MTHLFHHVLTRMAKKVLVRVVWQHCFYKYMMN